MDCIVQWATILSPILAVGLAWWTVISSAKETDKKIAALEESTTKQVESIKQIAILQIKTTQIKISKELWEARMRYQQSLEKKKDMQDYNRFFNQIGDGPNFFREHHEKGIDLSLEQEFQEKYAKVLEEYQAKLNKLSKELEG